MATNNLLVNNEYQVLRQSTNKVERSGHNLSQSRKFPVEVGKIYPIFCRKTLPSDSFKIDANILVKQLQPLLVPQMVSFSVQTAFYWIDYSLAFPEFEHFLINQRGEQKIELPYFQDIGSDSKLSSTLMGTVNQSSENNNSKYDLLNNIRPFLDFSQNSSNEKIDPLPFWAYQRVKRDFYTNIDRLSAEEYNVLFPSDPRKAQLQQGANYYASCSDDFSYDSTDSTATINLDKCIPLSKIGIHNVRGDYFVNSYPTPIRGETPTLSNNLTIDSFSAEIEQQENLLIDTFESELSLTTRGNTGVNLRLGSEPVSGSLYNVIGADGSILKTADSQVLTQDGGFFSKTSRNFENLNNLITNPITFKNIQGLSYDLSITTRELRLLDAITRKREIDILMKPRLKNYLNTYFGVDNYKHDSLYQPIFIGSTTQQILINDIEQTTTTDSSPLGRQGATAISLADNYVGEYYCRNYGCLLGVMFILPDYDYEPGLPHEWSERTPDDFYNPEYAHLSMQAVLNKELYVSDNDEWNNQVIGYGGVYDYYRTSNNYVSGLFLSRDNENEDIKQFAQVRRFQNDNKPEITTNFLNSNSAFDSSVFAVPTMPPFICQAVTRVRAVRPLPELATPDSNR